MSARPGRDAGWQRPRVTGPAAGAPRLADMRIARFTTGDDPMYGIVQAKDGREMVYGITGDPLYTEIRPTGTILPLDDVRLLAPVIPRSKVVSQKDWMSASFLEGMIQLYGRRKLICLELIEKETWA